MHGMMFREFFLFAADATSDGFVEDMIRDVSPKGRSAYDGEGPHDQADLMMMMDYVVRRTGYAFDELAHDFGRRLFHRFTVLHPELFIKQTTALDILQSIDDHIQEDIRWLAPSNTPSEIGFTRRSDNQLIMHYRSKRQLADLCAGLIEAALEHFGAEGVIDRQPVEQGRSEARFVITTHN